MIIHAPTRRTRRPIEYPVSDGEPLGETGIHIRLLFWLLDVVGRHLAAPRSSGADPAGPRSPTRQFHCGSNQFFYYRRGNPRANFAPDFYVLADVPPDPPLEVYKFWEHDHRPPIFILEATSNKTKHNDQVTKRLLYRRLGVAEYFLFDPIGGLLTPRLQGLRLTRRRYVPITATAAGGLISQQLGLEFRVSPTGELEVWSVSTGSRLLSGREEAEAAAAARDAAAAERDAAAAERDAAAAERDAAAAERDAAAAERDAAQARIAELEARLARLTTPSAEPEKQNPAQ